MKIRYLIPALLTCGLGLGSWLALAHDDDDDDDDHRESKRKARRSVSAPVDPVYKEECGSCHMAFPAGLLPSRSWTAMMSGLKDHFGENATLDKETTARLTVLLVTNAADQSDLRRSRKIARSIPEGEAPLRFTETSYFKRQHDEIKQKVWTRKSVGSPANCVACHRRAEEGVFSEDEIKIPR